MNHPLNPFYQLRRLYEWTLKWADHPQASWALGILSMVEGIFFPIPIDPFLLSLSAAQPKSSLKFAAIATFTSIIGGTIGYLVGATLWPYTQDFFFQYIMSADHFALVTKKFQENAFFTIFIASFTPVPYKVFAVASGVSGIGLPVFIAASILGRSLRFFAIGILFYFWGKEIKVFIEKRFNLVTLFVTLAIILFFVFYKL